MCGIAGIYGEKASVASIHSMLNAQQHRGPDYTGVEAQETIVLGHNRLSIIDLSEKANQPFIDDTNRYYIVFNGEIYNYLELKQEIPYDFKTSSDTEVLLAAYIYWGASCLEKLNGMFSFAIWDSIEKKLFAARDRFGVKPFYYHAAAKEFVFASEIKAIHAIGIEKRPHKKVWANYLCYGSYGMPEETFWEGIQQLPAGHYLEYSEDVLTIEKWYFFEEEIKNQQKNLSYAEAKEKYIALLKDSIKLRFRADVNVGFNISGGLDSSTLLAMVNNQFNVEKINAYTFYTGNDVYDELPWAEKMISNTIHPLQRVLLKSTEVAELAVTIQDHQDEPYGGVPTIAYAKIFEQARKDNVLVLLDGQGMDEQWAGYDYYFTETNQHTIQGMKLSPFKKHVLTEELLKYADKPEYPKHFEDELLNKQYRDLFYTKIPRALRFNDRVSMAYSTELREPFLDYRLVEFAFSLPKEFKINGTVQKYMLRDIVSKTLTDDITYAPKRPLQTPQREWLSNELKDMVDNAIRIIDNSIYATWFDVKELKEEWKRYQAGENESSFHLWQWISISLMINSKTAS
jgi:asparagine synthase (glutamine-hydrolysing)